MSYMWKRLGASAFYARSHRNYYFRARQRRFWRTLEESHAIKKKRRLRLFGRANVAGPGSVAPLAIDIVNNFTNSNNSLGQRAWPEVSGYPPVFGNFIGEIAHTGGGSYIWTGFSWEPAILGG